MNLFPFEKVRPGQKEFMDDVEYAIKNRMNIVANAPTGIGKTVATLVPALEYALKNDKTVFFLTPRHSQHMIAVETLRLMKKKANFVAVDLIGKKWLCPIEGVDFLSTNEFNEYCKYMRKEEKCPFYNNTWQHGKLTDGAKGKLMEISINSPVHADEIKLMSGNYCPYEILINLSKESSVIIADYYHLFSPYSNLLLRANKKIEDSILIIDEAHNLGERIMKLMSTSLSTRSLGWAIKEAEQFGFDMIKRQLKELKAALPKISDRDKIISKEELVEKIRYDYFDMVSNLKVAADEVREEKKKSYISSVAKFLDAWESSDEGFSRIYKRDKLGNAYIFFNCLDPSAVSKDIFDRAHSSILMSGTMKPLEMYIDILGLDKTRTIGKEYSTPFPKKNRLDIIVPGTTTKYSMRGNEMWKTMAEYITKLSDAIPGNLAVFFPSYDIKEKIMSFCKNSIKKQIIEEVRNLTKDEKTRIYRRFLANSFNGAVLFGVLGGSFSEGVDFPGNAINGVIIVGLSLRQPTLETKVMINYYDKKFHRGWDYAYIYPAVVKSLQAAGRCIRSEFDRGVIIYLDERYLWSNYRKLFPSDLNIKVTKEPCKYVKNFFGK